MVSILTRLLLVQYIYRPYGFFRMLQLRVSFSNSENQKCKYEEENGHIDGRGLYDTAIGFPSKRNQEV